MEDVVAPQPSQEASAIAQRRQTSPLGILLTGVAIGGTAYVVSRLLALEERVRTIEERGSGATLRSARLPEVVETPASSPRRGRSRERKPRMAPRERAAPSPTPSSASSSGGEDDNDADLDSVDDDEDVPPRPSRDEEMVIEEIETKTPP